MTQEFWGCVHICFFCCSLCYLFCPAALCFLLLFLCCSLLLQVFLVHSFLVPFPRCGSPVGHGHSEVSLSWRGSPVGCSPTGVSLLQPGSPLGQCPSGSCRVFMVPTRASCSASQLVKLVSLRCEVKISDVLLIPLESGS